MTGEAHSLSKRIVRALAGAAMSATGTTVHAHHGSDPASELALWEMIAVAVVVLLGFAGAGAIRRWLERRRAGDRRGEPAP